MNGKITMSRRGSTGRTSGILAGSSSFLSSSVIGVLASALSSLIASHRMNRRFGAEESLRSENAHLGGSFFRLPGDDDDGLPAAPVLQARERDRQQPRGE